MYFVVQFVKMLVLATFFPEMENTSGQLDIVGVSHLGIFHEHGQCNALTVDVFG